MYKVAFESGQVDALAALGLVKEAVGQGYPQQMQAQAQPEQNNAAIYGGMAGGAGTSGGSMLPSVAGGAAIGGIAGLGTGGVQLYNKLKASPKLQGIAEQYKTDPKRYQTAASGPRPLTAVGRRNRLVGRMGQRMQRGIRGKGLVGLGLGAAAGLGTYFATRPGEEG